MSQAISTKTVTTKEGLAEVYESSKAGEFTVELPRYGETRGSFLWFDGGNRLESLLWVDGERLVFSAKKNEDLAGAAMSERQVCELMARTMFTYAYNLEGAPA